LREKRGLSDETIGDLVGDDEGGKGIEIGDGIVGLAEWVVRLGGLDLSRLMGAVI
jgi:hypothetical protein